LEVSVAAWVVSVAAVMAAALAAWLEGNFRGRPDLDLGFVNHGGMWGDLVLLPVANAVIVPWLSPGIWLIGPLLVASGLSVWLHIRWHGGAGVGAREHMWPTRRHARWWRDLSASGWLHVLYVAGEVALLIAYALTPMPARVVMIVSVALTVHIPLGLLLPARMLTGRWSSHVLLVPALALVWSVAAVKLYS
jgi:hypothetical protein